MINIPRFSLDLQRGIPLADPDGDLCLFKHAAQRYGQVLSLLSAMVNATPHGLATVELDAIKKLVEDNKELQIIEGANGTDVVLRIVDSPGPKVGMPD